MFTAMSLHPAVQNIAEVNQKKRDQANKGMADLIVKLLSVECLEQTKKAIRYEGELAIESGFKLLGEVAARELFSNPKVSAGLSELDKYVDQDAFNKKLEVK